MHREEKAQASEKEKLIFGFRIYRTKTESYSKRGESCRDRRKNRK